MFCSKCEKTIPDNAVFCSGCGAQMSTSPPTIQLPVTSHVSGYMPTPTNPPAAGYPSTLGYPPTQGYPQVPVNPQQQFLQQMYPQMPYRQNHYQQQLHAIIVSPTPLNIVQIICAAIGVIALFLPFLSIDIPIIGNIGTISFIQALTGSMPVLVLLCVLCVFAVAVLTLFNKLNIVKIITAVAALILVFYYGFIDKVSFVTLLADSSGALGDIANDALSYLDGITSGFASSLVNRSIGMGKGGYLLIMTMVVCIIINIIESAKPRQR